MLITGGAGFIGRRVVSRLVGTATSVVVTSRRDAAALGFDATVEVATVDLADRGAVAALIQRVQPDAVLHLASAVTGTRDRAAVFATFDENLASTVALLDAVAEHAPRARFVHAGSLEEPAPGDVAPPSSPYAAAKGAASAYVRMYHATYGVEASIARIFMVYGPGQQNVDRLVPYVTRALLRATSPRLSSGVRLVDWVFVDDVAEGLVRLASSSTAAGHTVDLGTGVLHSVRAVAERVTALVATDAEPIFDPTLDRLDEQHRVADVATTRARLGWAPSTDLDAGLRATIAYFREELDQ